MKRNIAFNKNLSDYLQTYFSLVQGEFDARLCYEYITPNNKEEIFYIQTKTLIFPEDDDFLDLTMIESNRLINMHVHAKKPGNKILKKDTIFDSIPEKEKETNYSFKCGIKKPLIQNGLILFMKPRNELIGQKMPKTNGYDFITIDNEIIKKTYIQELKCKRPRIVNYSKTFPNISPYAHD